MPGIGALGALALGEIANMAQQGLQNVFVSGDRWCSGLFMAGVTGLAGGFIGGKTFEAAMFNAWTRAGYRMSWKNYLSLGNLARSFGGSFIGNVSPDKLAHGVADKNGPFQ